LPVTGCFQFAEGRNWQQFRSELVRIHRSGGNFPGGRAGWQQRLTFARFGQLDEVDVEAILNFAETFLLNTARMLDGNVIGATATVPKGSISRGN
jgi:hypothetical protein